MSTRTEQVVHALTDADLLDVRRHDQAIAAINAIGTSPPAPESGFASADNRHVRTRSPRIARVLSWDPALGTLAPIRRPGTRRSVQAVTAPGRLE